MKKITYPNGTIEWISNEQEKASKDKYETINKGSDLTDAQVKDLVYELAKKENLI